jgi:hypothetical protein
VFQVRDEWDDLNDFQKEFSMKRVINALTAAGLHTSQFYSVQRDEVYCKIRCPRDRLVAQAVRAYSCLAGCSAMSIFQYTYPLVKKT